MSQSLKEDPATDYLFDVILSLKDRKECYRLFDDLCTVKEIESLAQRLEVSKMLKEKKTYMEIAEKTGTSTATISRVNRILQYGNGAMDEILERLRDHG